jgi:hypothetical protein
LKEIISLIQKKGFDPVIKDFDRCLV